MIEGIISNICFVAKHDILCAQEDSSDADADKLTG